MKQFVLIIPLVLILLLSNSYVAGQNSPADVELATVVNIIDGDTIDVRFLMGTTTHDLGATARVRYIGINTPESGESCGSEATRANQALVANKTVALRKDASETDRYGRLLRYVYVDGTFVNAELVANGWAEAVEYPPDTAFAVWFEYLGEQAKTANTGCHAFNAFGAVLPTTTPALAGVTVTTNSTVNLRGGPGTNYPITGTLSAGQSATAEGKNGEWLYLGNNQWVAAWVVGVSGSISALPNRTAPAAPAAQSQPAAPQQPAQPAVQPPPAQPVAPAFTCDCSKTCSAMASCEEAYFQLNQCGCRQRDGDGDGVPCESICPGG